MKLFYCLHEKELCTMLSRNVSSVFIAFTFTLTGFARYLKGSTDKHGTKGTTEGMGDTHVPQRYRLLGIQEECKYMDI